MHCHHSYYPAALHGLSLPAPNHNPFFVTINPSVHKPLIFSRLTHRHNTRAISTEDDQEEAPPLEISHFSRRQNARSTACLLYSGPQAKPKQSLSPHEEEELQRNRVAEEMSLATRRAPRFPGSIGFPSAERLGPPLELAGVVDTDDRVLKRALKVRRGVAAETLKEALRAGKLSVTYSANLVSTLGGFVDRVVIEAAAMKEDPEFSHTSFNARAKSYIQRSGIVPLVK